MFSKAITLAKIQPVSQYYYFTEERWEKEIFKIGTFDGFKVAVKEIKDLPDKGVFVTAIPKEVIDTLRPCYDFHLNIRIVNDITRSSWEFKDVNNVITHDTLKSPSYLCQAIMTGGQPAIDINDTHLALLSRATVVPKIVDDKIVDKLSVAMQKAVRDSARSVLPEFTIQGNDYTVTIQVSASPALQFRLRDKDVGKFKL